MGIKQRLGLALKILRKKDFTLRETDPWLSSLLFTSGQDLSNYQAYSQIVTAFACINAIMKEVSSVPLYIYKQLKDGSELVEGEPVCQLIENPNPNFTFDELRELIEMWLLIFGTGYLHKTKEYGRDIFHPRHPSYMVPNTQKYYPPDYYVFKTEAALNIPTQDLIVFRKVNPNSFVSGVPPLQVALSQCNIDSNSIEHIKKFFANATVLSGLITFKETLNKNEYDRIVSDWNKQYQGTDKHYKVGILGTDATFQRYMSSLAELDLTNLRDMVSLDVCKAFNTQPAIISDHKHSNYADAKTQQEIQLTYNTIPECRKLESIITLALKRFYGSQYFALHDFNAHPVYARMLKEKRVGELEFVKNRVWTTNEWRVENDLKPVPWGDGIWGSLMDIEIATLPPNEALYYPESEQLAEALEVLTTKQLEPPESVRAFNSRKLLTKEERVKFWKRFDVLQRSKDNKFTITMKKLFKEQAKRVLKNWQEFTGGKAFKGLEDFEPFMLEDEVIYFGKATRHLFLSFIRDAADLAMVDIPTGRTYTLSQRVIMWINETIRKDFTLVHTSTKKEIADAIKEGIRNGESIWQIEERLKGVFDYAHDFRSERIARTETLGANNFGTIEGYEQSGVVEKKEWLATQDERTRDAHYAADGQVVNLDESFDIGGEKADYPGDPQLSAGNRINCRCTTLAVLKEEA